MKEAVEAYRRALEIQPRNPRAAYNLGISLQALGCVDEAIEAYRRALDSQPDLHDAANNLGSALYDRGHLEEAVKAYHHALTVQPAFAEAENNLGNALRAQGKLNEAIAAFRRALDLKPEYPEAASNLGLAFHATGRLEEAAEAYRRALAVREEFAEAENNLGNALLAQGDHEGPSSAYHRALALRPSYVSAHSNLLMCEQYQRGATLAGLARLHAEWDERHATAQRELEAVGPGARPRAADPPGIRLPRPPSPSRRLLPGSGCSRTSTRVSSRWFAITAGPIATITPPARGGGDPVARRSRGCQRCARRADPRGPNRHPVRHVGPHRRPSPDALRAAACADPDHVDRVRRDDRPGRDGLPDRRSVPRPPRGGGSLLRESPPDARWLRLLRAAGRGARGRSAAGA